MAAIIKDNKLEELRRELARRGPEDLDRDDRRDEESSISLPCADMTCPCRIVKKRRC